MRKKISHSTPLFTVLRLLVLPFFVIAALWPREASAQYNTSSSMAQGLNGTWFFSLDQLSAGEEQNRYSAKYPTNRWDTVTVPHCFSVDKRFEFYTGKCWYRRSFELSPSAGKRLILNFDGVYYRCKVWLNDKLIGSHEGGYTPFNFDITGRALKGNNTLVVKVDNSWGVDTMPGAKPAKPVSDAPINQMFAWIPYGGIVRPVYITEKPELYISALKIEAEPNLKTGIAQVKITSFVENTSDKTVTIAPEAYLAYKGRFLPVGKLSAVPVIIAAHSNGQLHWNSVLAASKVKLWDTESPELYTAMVVVKGDTLKREFGIRKIEVVGNRLMLNGKPVRMGGANRVIDYPELGSKEPDSILERDMLLMKKAGMNFQRIYHHPASEYLLTLADRYGMLIIEENGNTALKDVQLKDTAMRANFKRQYAEMLRRDWNHPSLIAWSVGNEFDSATPEGISWVRDMKAYSKSIDSRLVTFASNQLWNKNVVTGTDEASIYVDFISANIYDDHLNRIRHIHKLYPDKPLLLSEFGYRFDRVRDEIERIQKTKAVLDVVRSSDYVIGASVWTFNDYRSNYIGTNPNGYRPWGIVDPFRNPRPLYYFLQAEYCPVTITQKGAIQVADGLQTLTMVIQGRTDFPSYAIKNYQLRWGGALFNVPKVSPGESVELKISSPLTIPRGLELLNASGLVILNQPVK